MELYRMGFIVTTAANVAGMFLSKAKLEFMIGGLICIVGYAVIDSILELRKEIQSKKEV